eukprot:CAMPEP_0206526320 /NCGR_PEP_ID=MMETSP0325_2-20121206/653_1 /ASSEMBLY_ACC=CAM_ASM_000347 /TAXON_ID=2866 /ORGANISM="Crypthecodinium cohnii, Strain Seligo" /LENGTH=82 /DNA_ID=CAMNT_0054021457 /DNA_START=303 /DNA_END=551 /DNA_ORIENTATION=+
MSSPQGISMFFVRDDLDWDISCKWMAHPAQPRMFFAVFQSESDRQSLVVLASWRIWLFSEDDVPKKFVAIALRRPFGPFYTT